MLNKIFRKSSKPEFELVGYGTVRLNRDKSGGYWFGNVQTSMKNGLLELTIEVIEGGQPTEWQIKLIKEFESNWKQTEDKLFDLMYRTFVNTKWEKEKHELRQMYFLAALTLKRGDSEWWVVLESELNVPSTFDFFPRFTLKDGEITWSNIS